MEVLKSLCLYKRMLAPGVCKGGSAFSQFLGLPIFWKNCGQNAHEPVARARFSKNAFLIEWSGHMKMRSEKCARDSVACASRCMCAPLLEDEVGKIRTRL